LELFCCFERFSYINPSPKLCGFTQKNLGNAAQKTPFPAAEVDPFQIFAKSVSGLQRVDVFDPPEARLIVEYQKQGNDV